MEFQIDDKTRLVPEGNSWALESLIERKVGPLSKTHPPGELYTEWVPKWWSSFGAVVKSHHEERLMKCKDIRDVRAMYDYLNKRIEALAEQVRNINTKAKDGEEKE